MLLDLSGCKPSFVAALTREFQEARLLRDLQVRKDQQLAAERKTEHRAMDGLGRVRMQVDGGSFHYWGQRLGYECWADDQFKREFERDNPEVRIKCGGTKTQVGYGSPTGRTGLELVTRGGVRGTKSY